MKSHSSGIGRVPEVTADAPAEEAAIRRVLFENSRDGIVTLDGQGRVFEANARFAEMLGYTQDELRGLGVWDWDAQFPRAELEAMVAGSDAAGARFETRHRRKDGTLLDVEIVANGIARGAGKLIFCVCRDVTERKQADRALRESQERLRRALENIPDVIVVYDRDLTIRYVNPATTAITGRPVEDFLGKRDDEIFPPEIHEAYLPALRAALETGRPHDVEVELPLRDGPRFLHIECLPLLDEAGGVREIMGITHDLTLRKAYERETRRLNRLHATVSSLNRAMLRTGTRDQLFQEVCRIAVEEAGFKLVWVGLLDREASRVLPVARAGTPEEYLDDLVIDVGDDAPASGPARACVVANAPAVSNDFLSDPQTTPWHEPARRHGLLSAASFPLHRGGRVVGIFVVYAGERDVFGPQEVALLEEAAGTISFGLDYLDRVERERVAAESLRTREALYRAVIETSGDGFWMADPEGRLLEVNDAYVRRSGYSREELLRMRISELDVHETSEDVVARMQQIKARGSHLFEVVHRRKDGTTWPVEVRVAYWPNLEGRFFCFLHDISARKSNEAAVRLWANAFEHCAHGIAIGDPATNRIATCNPAYATLLGREVDEIRGWEILNAYLPEYHEDISRQISDADRTGHARFEAEMRRSDDATFPVQADVVTVRGGSGEPLYRVATVQDITERRRAEEHLRQRLALQTQLARIAASVPGVIHTFRLGTDGRMTMPFAVPAVEELLGIPAEELAVDLTGFVGNVHPEDRERAGARLDEASRTLSVWHDEYRYRHPAGGERWIAGWSAPHTQEDGSILWHGLLMDVTERKRGEEQLRELNASLERRVAERTAELESMLANATVGLAFADRELRCIRINDWLAAIDGRPAEAHLGRPIHEILPPGANPVVSDILEVFETGRPCAGGELSVQSPIRLGEDRHFLVSHYPVFRGDGTVMSVGTALSDITERRKSERQLAELNRALEAEIEERRRLEETLRRRSDELAVANQQLEHSVRVKDEFLANMSHELRTPLTGILSIAESLLEGVYGPVNPGQRRAILDSHECGKHLLSLINDILDVAKIEAGMVTLDRREFGVSGICQASERFVKEPAQKKSISVTVGRDPDVETLVADERRLKQILVNLLSNAVKFTPRGGRVGLEVRGDRDRREATFTVWDTGIGIDAEQLGTLFRPFVQLDSGLSRHYEGTGLGLVLVKKYTELHGGSLQVESEPGKGSRFTVALPWTPREPRVAEVPPTERAATDPPEPRPSVGRAIAPRVLLVDDSYASVRAVRDYLTFKGCWVEVANDGRTAIDLARAEPPDLILMDIQMPQMDGLEAIRQIRLLPRLSTIPIIALTALAMRGDRERVLQAGASDYVSKPADLVALHRRIRELLERPRE